MDELAKAIDRVMNISTPVMCGDNLAIVICSHFDDGEDGDDDCGWSPSAVKAYEQIKAAFEAHFKPAAEALQSLAAENARLTALVQTQGQGWQDIASAPRDESRFLIAYTVRGDGPQVREGRWHVEQQQFTSVNGFLFFDTAYAWMPLPAAPIATLGETK